MAARNHIELVEKTVNVLEALADGQAGSSLAGVAERTALVKSTAFRILYTLKELGYVEQAERNGNYRLTLKALALGRRAAMRPTLINIARPHLVRLRDQLQESSWLAEWRRREAVLLEAIEAPHKLRLSLELGDVCPLHASALGKAIAAHLTPDELREAVGTGPLPRYTSKTVSSRFRLAQELERVRKQGYAVNEQETVDGALLVGAAVFDANRRVCAAVSVSCPMARCPEPKRQAMIRGVMAAAESISGQLAALGYVSRP
jgi:IclR family acetate operon transcriptional repressor